MSRLLKVLAVVLVLFALLVACGPTGGGATPGALPDTGETPGGGVATPEGTAIIQDQTPEGGLATPEGTPLVSLTPEAGAEAAVSMSGSQFTPQTLEVAAGTTVVWTNDDSVAHTVTSDDGLFDSMELASGDTYSFTFDQAGTYPYHCSLHPNMIGEVIVQ
ncbi:MAG: cupredoxin domain-containing protein [Anaerolineae bacterium]